VDPKPGVDPAHGPAVALEMLGEPARMQAGGQQLGRVDDPGAAAEEVSAGSPATSGGWSHSWDTPTSSPPVPRAQTISVADGSSETMRTGRLRAAADGDLGGDQDAGGGGRAQVDLA
jgi:hypothetical protein